MLKIRGVLRLKYEFARSDREVGVNWGGGSAVGRSVIIFPVCRKSRLEPDHDPPIATWLAITRPWFFRSGFESCDKAKAEGGGGQLLQRWILAPTVQPSSF